jgi:hypothetical protein
MRIRYIGMSMNVKHRLKCHLKSGYPHVASQKWIAGLRNEGLAPVQQVLFTGLTKEQALRVEARLINLHVKHYPDVSIQSHVHRKDNLSEFTKLWDKCSERERLLIERIIAQQSIVSVAS